MLPMLLKLTESDKRLIIAFLLIFILLFVIIGAIGYLIVRIMKWQGKKLDSCVSDVVYTRVITDKKKFSKFAHKKNWIIFYKGARIPVIIMLVSSLFLLLSFLIKRHFDATFQLDLFSIEKGFGSILFIWDFNGVITVDPLTLSLSFRLPVLINEPHIVDDGWISYVFIPSMAVGILWYLWHVQSLISRTLRIKKLSESIFDKNLDNFNQNEQLMNSINAGTAPLNGGQSKTKEE